jgi:hypothetical protein
LRIVVDEQHCVQGRLLQSEQTVSHSRTAINPADGPGRPIDARRSVPSGRR